MLARDIMTPHVITVRADATVGEAIRLMLQHRISGLPVVDAAGKLAGVVTEGDFLRRTEAGTENRRSSWLEFLLGPGRLAAEYIHTHGRKIHEVMTDKVFTVEETTPLTEVVRLMEVSRIKRVPVMRGAKLVGIISRANLLQLLGRVIGEVKPMSKDDADIRARILAELENQSWAPTADVNVIVRDGIVELKGAIFDERERVALKVAAENVPGVKTVRDHLIWIEPISGTAIDPPPETPVAAAR
jgi:CBS domain-containing protein